MATVLGALRWDMFRIAKWIRDLIGGDKGVSSAVLALRMKGQDEAYISTIE